MSFRSMKLIVPIILYMIIGLGAASAATSYYSWHGNLEVGQSIHIEGLTLIVDQNNATKELALIIQNSSSILGLLKAGEESEFGAIKVSFKEFNGYGIVDISSEKPFSISFSTTKDYLEDIRRLQEENAILKATNDNLTKKLQELQAENKKLQDKVNELQEALSKNKKMSEDFNGLQLKILNLTKENRELKEKLANLTDKYNKLKGENDFLKSQLETYKSVFSGLVQQVEKQTEKTYVEEAKDAEKDAKRLWWAAIVSTLLVGGFGMLMYRKKRKYELE